MAFNAKQHDRVIQRTITDIQDGVFDNIKGLENAIADLISQGFDPITIRQPLLTTFQQWSNEIKSSAKQMADISQDYNKQTGFETTIQDQQAEQVLVDQTANTIGSVVDGGAEGVLEIITLGAAAGLTTALITQQARAKISGVLYDSDNPAIRREQRKLKKMMRTGGYTSDEYQSVVSKIKRLAPTINTANSLREQTRATVEDGVMNFQGAYSSGVNKRNEVERFTYAGGVIETTRPFCKGLDGQTLNRSDIDSIWAGQWAGKEPGDPMVVRGGYNCRHYWIPVVED